MEPACNSRLDAALARFSEAVSRLDTAVEQGLSRARDAARLEAELRSANEERDGLVVRVASLEDEARELAGLTDEVEDRLDGATG